MKKLIDWILGLFKKPKEEFEPIEFKAWPFPAVSEDFDPRPKRKPRVAKATTRPKKPVVKKAITVAKKTTKKAK